MGAGLSRIEDPRVGTLGFLHVLFRGLRGRCDQACTCVVEPLVWQQGYHRETLTTDLRVQTEVPQFMIRPPAESAVGYLDEPEDIELSIIGSMQRRWAV